jgi:hypothetical protein
VRANNQKGIVPGLARRAQVLLLLCCVVLAQQGVMLHALSHLKFSDSKQTEVSQPAPPSDQLCAQCLAYQGVGSALADSGAAAATVDPVASSLFAPVEEFFPVAGAPFSSRAPPPLLS